MSSSESSSAPSPSPPASPEASFHHEPPNLERLVLHFVSAKRSLSSGSHVWQANEFVTSSRGLIEEIAGLNAKNSFARRGVDEQLDTLHAIRDGVADVGENAASEFSATLAALDDAHGRLEETLDALRNTVVDASLQRTSGRPATPSNNIHVSGEEPESSETTASEKKTLYDFIDESTHTDLLASLRALIDSFKSAHDELDDDLGTFDGSLRHISEILQEGTVTNSGPQDKRTIYDEPAPTIPQLFRGMEDHASEMATALQSLVKHYDLCVTALKHTEGGGEAAKQAIQAQDISTSREESLYRKTAPLPISDEERTEMLRVLETDAQEVEDVMSDIRDHAAELESQYEQLRRHALHSRSSHSNLRTALTLFHDMKIALPAHILASKTFRESWHDIQHSITAKTEELASLATFYSDFAGSYAKVLQEVARRKGAEAQMRKLAAKAQREIDRLYEADREAREEFMEKVRGYLPNDIWPGANERGVKWEVGAVEP